MLHKSCQQCGKTIDSGHVYGEDDGKWSGVFIEKSAQQSMHLTSGSLRGLWASFWLRVSSAFKHFTTPPTGR
jgi:hypothetical protein